jgi:CPA2 family monovalent cation:H+ antiporter-2
MEGIDLIQDFAILLLAAGIAGTLCKRVGLSVIVGYLLAGLVIGPHTPPFSMIVDEHRIVALSQVGLVFLMFAIGLELSLTKLGRLGMPTIMATAIGAFFMLNFTLLLGYFVHWTILQSLFVAAMLMVSSSVVIAKIMHEHQLNHERVAQMALAITIVEDVVAVVMLTLLASQGTSESESLSGAITGIGAFVVLLLGAGLVLLPRLFRRLEARPDPELQTIVVSALLFLLAFCAVKAGYSLALGAFLFGALMAEMPQKASIEKSFSGLRDLFSSIFFVSIGMMIDLKSLVDVWPLVLGLGLFSLTVRPIACGIALMLVGIPPREARRGGLLLTPLGEFTFIIAQAGIGAAILPTSFYALAVGLSLFTVLATPILNHFSDPILNAIDRVEPRWVTRFFAAYHAWLQQLQQRPAPALAWKLIRGRFIQIGVEMLFITGLLIFSGQILSAISTSFVATWLEGSMLTVAFWSGMSLFVLVPLVAVWRNVTTVSLIMAENFGRHFLPAPVLNHAIRALGAVGLGYWLYAILPIHAFTWWGWIIVIVATIVVVAIYSNRLIYWYSTWQTSVNEVLADNNHKDHEPAAESRVEARTALGQGLEAWDTRLIECVVPDAAAYVGCTLSELALPSRFGISVIEVERNGYVIGSPGPDLMLYPGDKLLLIGEAAALEPARAFLANESRLADRTNTFGGAVLETYQVASGPRVGNSFADLQIAQNTGVRVIAIQRGDQRIVNPTGEERLLENDQLLLFGTLDRVRHFRQWLAMADTLESAS